MRGTSDGRVGRVNHVVEYLVGGDRLQRSRGKQTIQISKIISLKTVEIATLPLPHRARVGRGAVSEKKGGCGAGSKRQWGPWVCRAWTSYYIRSLKYQVVSFWGSGEGGGGGGPRSNMPRSTNVSFRRRFL